MKILVVSDTHRDETSLEKVLNLEKPNMLIHLGDIEGSEEKIEEMSNCDTVMVGGNNDFFSFLPEEKEVYLKGYKAFLVHGHTFRVGLGIEELRAEAKIKKCRFAMYGHTHKPYYEDKDNLIILNPGSISYPRQDGRNKSYAIININDNDEILVEIKYL